MPDSSMDVSGIWRLTGVDPEGVQRVNIEGRVPGHVHDDLHRAGLIKDPFWRDQADDCQWVEHWDWVYSREFTLPDDFSQSWCVLEFKGLDTFATIILNGVVLGRTDDMFIPHGFDVGGVLRPGVNRLEVSLASIDKPLEGKDRDKYFGCFSSERVYLRKLQCTFAWDWVHRLVSAGIWQPVLLHTYDSARVKDVFVYTSSLKPDAAEIKVQVETERRTKDSLSAKVEIAEPAGEVVSRRTVDMPSDQASLAISVPHPELWWPNGYGEQPIYTCRVELTAAGKVVDRKTVDFGIRTVAIEEVPDQDGSSFTLLVNGERIFCKGGNWVPADPFPSRITPEKYERLIQLAKDANMNLLRCWGGGLYEPEAFWKACDRHGIMISQDFLLACAAYPEDDSEFMALLKTEFEAAIRMLRNHPSLAWWSGDNELGLNDSPDDEYWGKKISAEISAPLCAELDPSRPFRPTSPFGGMKNNCLTSGDCHVSAWYDVRWVQTDMADYKARIEQNVGRFMSEYAVPGAPPKRSLLKFMTEEDIADPEGRMWEYHTNDNPYKGSTAITHYRMLETSAARLFGDPRDADENVRRMEYFHYEWVRLTVEAARRRKFWCSGIQFWMYNDCWPASGWSLVDYYGFPKAGWYAMKRACKPVIASIQDAGDSFVFWVCNDLLEPVSGRLSIRVQPWTGAPLRTREVSFDVPANVSQAVCEVTKAELSGTLTAQSMLVCDLASDAGNDRTLFHAGMPREMDLPPARLEVTREDGRGSGSITISTDNYARTVTLDADFNFSDNYFDLLPGETRTITWHDPTGAASTPIIPVTCWNRDR